MSSNKLQIGISTATYFGKAVTEDSFQYIKQTGAKVCEVFLSTFSEYEWEFANLLKTRAEGLRVHSVHSLTNEFEPELLMNKVERTKRDAENLFRKVLTVGETIGAQYYTFHGATLLKKRKYIHDYDYLAKRVNELREIASEYGICLTYENVHWTYFSHPQYYVNLLKKIPDLKCTFDNKQAIQSGIDMQEYLKVMTKNLATVHVCDVDDNGKTAVCGKGTFDFKELFRILKGEGVSAPVLMELYSEDYQDFQQVKDGYEYLCECLETV